MASDDQGLPPPRPRWSGPMIDTVTADERRAALEAMAFEPDPTRRRIEPMLLGTVGLASIDPLGDRYEGESNDLALVIARESADHAFETRVLAQAAIEVWSVATEGSAASRTALLRATGAFLLHDVATWIALGRRVSHPEEAGRERRPQAEGGTGAAPTKQGHKGEPPVPEPSKTEPQLDVPDADSGEASGGDAARDPAEEPNVGGATPDSGREG